MMSLAEQQFIAMCNVDVVRDESLCSFSLPFDRRARPPRIPSMNSEMEYA